MNFKLWLEKLEILSHKPITDDYWTKAGGVYAKIHRYQPNNPQWLKSFHKDYDITTYTMPVKDDKFIHFTPKENIPQILDSNTLGKGNAFAVSTTFGTWFPIVQFNHIARMLPNSLGHSDMVKFKKLNKKSNRRIPDMGNEIAAILFKTNDIPNHASQEEVYWDNPIKIHSTQLLSSREAINILKHTPEEIEYPNRVEYT